MKNPAKVGQEDGNAIMGISIFRELLRKRREAEADLGTALDSAEAGVRRRKVPKQVVAQPSANGGSGGPPDEAGPDARLSPNVISNRGHSQQVTGGTCNESSAKGLAQQCRDAEQRKQDLAAQQENVKNQISQLQLKLESLSTGKLELMLQLKQVCARRLGLALCPGLPCVCRTVPDTNLLLAQIWHWTVSCWHHPKDRCSGRCDQ